jgi:hypothetical protein
VTRQLIAVEFSPGGRMYTYHNDGEPLANGEDVVVLTPRGPKTVRVVSIHPAPPKVETKPIVGRADRPQPAQQRSLL